MDALTGRLTVRNDDIEVVAMVRAWEALGLGIEDSDWSDHQLVLGLGQNGRRFEDYPWFVLDSYQLHRADPASHVSPGP